MRERSAKLPLPTSRHMLQDDWRENAIHPALPGLLQERGQELGSCEPPVQYMGPTQGQTLALLAL